jgi:hypothetical protein
MTARRAPGQVALIRECLARYIPDAAGEPLTLKGCVYTVSPDEDFIIDAVPGVPQAVFASCCSGHGFKFASAIGEILADLSTSGQSAFDLTALLARPPRGLSATRNESQPWPAQPKTAAASSPCSTAMSLFVCNDTLMKLAREVYPAGQAIALRTIFAVAPASPWSLPCARRQADAGPSPRSCCCAA